MGGSAVFMPLVGSKTMSIKIEIQNFRVFIEFVCPLLIIISSQDAVNLEP
jgi:hypothetical protein